MVLQKELCIFYALINIKGRSCLRDFQLESDADPLRFRLSVRGLERCDVRPRVAVNQILIAIFFVESRNPPLLRDAGAACNVG